MLYFKERLLLADYQLIANEIIYRFFSIFPQKA